MDDMTAGCRSAGSAVLARRLPTPTLTLLLCLLASLLAPLGGHAQDDAAESTPSDTADAAPYTAQTVPLPGPDESTRAFREIVGGADAAGFGGQSRAELEIAVAPMPLTEIDARADAALGYLNTVASELSTTLIRYQRQQLAGADADALEQLRARSELIAAFKKDLIARTNILLTAAEEKGADKTEAHRYVDVVAALQVPEPIDGTARSAEQQARDAVRAVREEPPVHDRPVPWEVPVDELELELQPLQQAQIEERVGKWLNILQRQVRERIRMDIALKKTENQGQREALAHMVTDQQEVIAAIVERLEAVLAVLAKRGGDVGPAKSYISNATGQRLDFTNPSVFYAQARAWLVNPSGGLRLGLSVLKFCSIVALFWLISGVIGALIAAALRRLPKTSSLLHDFLVGGSRRVVMVIGLLVAAASVNIPIAPLAAAIGAAGLVIGLALQGTLSNFASGILILIYRPFDVGDVINAGGVFGKVDAMTLVSTRILTFDNQVNMVPNNSIWNGVITNATALDTRRVDMVFGIGYGDDADQAQRIIEEVVKEHSMVLETPAPTIRMNELADNSVNFIVRPWARTTQYWDVYWDVTKRVKERFDAEGINIPYPQRDLHLSGPIEVVLGERKASAPAAPAAAPAPVDTPVLDDSQPSTAEPGPPGD